MLISTMMRAVAFFALAFGSVVPAWAGRPIQIDSPTGAPACSLGATSCGFLDISASGRFSRAYVYREGIVSVDALLPVGATSADPASLGDGIWFAPGFSDGNAYEVNAFFAVGFEDIPPAFAINFYLPGAPREDEFGFPFDPEFQVQLAAGNGRFRDPINFTGGWDGVLAGFGYSDTGRPVADALIGFSWGGGNVQTVRNADGLLVGPRAADTDFVSTAGIQQVDEEGNVTFSAPTRFVPLFAPTAVPEPATWAMLVAGFGLAGAALRRRPRGVTALA